MKGSAARVDPDSEQREKDVVERPQKFGHENRETARVSA